MDKEKLDVEVTEEEVNAGQSEQVDTPKEPVDGEPKVTVAEMQRRLKNQEDKLRAEFQEAQDEAEKLRKMNAEQKAQYENEKKDAEIAKLKAELNRSALEKEASAMLGEADIIADEQILNYVVRETAEETQEAINQFVELVNGLAEDKAKKALAGKTPKRVDQVTPKQKSYSDLSFVEKVQLKGSNPDLYQRLLESERNE